MKYSIFNILCRDRYQLYITSFNHAGLSQPSETITTKTRGEGKYLTGSSLLLNIRPVIDLTTSNHCSFYYQG